MQDLPSSIRVAATGLAPHVESPLPAERSPIGASTLVESPLPAGMGAHVRVGPAAPIRPSFANMPIDPGPPMPGYAHVGASAQPVMAHAATGQPGLATAVRAAASLEARVDVLERRIIEDCLQRNNYRRKETAAELGISRVTLYNKMKKFGLM
jgi:DNA-binding NtrC family response regulator